MSKRTFILASAALVAVAVAPFALAAGEGNPVRGGSRNPSSDPSVAYTRETQFIANNSTYGTRLSNKSDNGGGAIYGCRSGVGGSAKGNEACLRASNLAKGFAFEFATNGDTGGFIDVPGGDSAKPFTTNATGVATGLNADRVDGMSAADIIKAAGGTPPATSTPSPSSPPFAQVTTDGKLGASRGTLSSSKPGTGHYIVVFSGDLGGCAVQATPVTSNSSTISAQVTVAGDKKSTTVDVRVFNFSTAAGGAVSVVQADETAHVAFTC